MNSVSFIKSRIDKIEERLNHDDIQVKKLVKS